MVDAGIRHWTDQNTSAAGWRTLISPQDIVGIKVNAAPGPVIGTRPSVARAVASALIDAGIPKKNIVIWDKFRDELHRSGFFQVGRDLNVEVEDTIRTGFERHIHHTQALVAPLERGDLEMGHARALLGLPAEQQTVAARQVVAKGLTVRQTEALVRQWLNPRRDATQQRTNPDIERLQQDLGERLGAEVKLQHGARGKGRLVISYSSLDELDGILEHIR